MDSSNVTTPEMLEAGGEIISQFEFGWSNPKEVARLVYRAMEEKRLQHSSQQDSDIRPTFREALATRWAEVSQRKP